MCCHEGCHNKCDRLVSQGQEPVLDNKRACGSSENSDSRMSAYPVAVIKLTIGKDVFRYRSISCWICTLSCWSISCSIRSCSYDAKRRTFLTIYWVLPVLQLDLQKHQTGFWASCFEKVVYNTLVALLKALLLHNEPQSVLEPLHAHIKPLYHVLLVWARHNARRWRLSRKAKCIIMFLQCLKENDNIMMDLCTAYQ